MTLHVPVCSSVMQWHVVTSPFSRGSFRTVQSMQRSVNDAALCELSISWLSFHSHCNIVTEIHVPTYKPHNLLHNTLPAYNLARMPGCQDANLPCFKLAPHRFQPKLLTLSPGKDNHNNPQPLPPSQPSPPPPHWPHLAVWAPPALISAWISR